MRGSDAIDARAAQIQAWAHFLDGLSQPEKVIAAAHGVDVDAVARDFHALYADARENRFQAARALDRWRLALAEQQAAADAYLAWRKVLRAELRVLDARPPDDPEVRLRLDAVRAGFKVEHRRVRGVLAESAWVAARIADVPLPIAGEWARTLTSLVERLGRATDSTADAEVHRALVTEGSAQIVERLASAKRFRTLDWARLRLVVPELPPLPKVVESPRGSRGRKETAGEG